MSRGRRFLTFQLPLILYLALIFFLSSGPVPSPKLQEVPDYYLHSLEYGGLWLPALLTIAYGVSDEFHQMFVPTRDASIADVGSDAVGSLLGIVLLPGCRRLISVFRA